MLFHLSSELSWKRCGNFSVLFPDLEDDWMDATIHQKLPEEKRQIGGRIACGRTGR